MFPLLPALLFSNRFGTWHLKAWHVMCVADCGCINWRVFNITFVSWNKKGCHGSSVSEKQNVQYKKKTYHNIILINSGGLGYDMWHVTCDNDTCHLTLQLTNNDHFRLIVLFHFFDHIYPICGLTKTTVGGSENFSLGILLLASSPLSFSLLPLTHLIVGVSINHREHNYKAVAPCNPAGTNLERRDEEQKKKEGIGGEEREKRRWREERHKRWGEGIRGWEERQQRHIKSVHKPESTVLFLICSIQHFHCHLLSIQHISLEIYILNGRICEHMKWIQVCKQVCETFCNSVSCGWMHGACERVLAVCPLLSLTSLVPACKPEHTATYSTYHKCHWTCYCDSGVSLHSSPRHIHQTHQPWCARLPPWCNKQKNEFDASNKGYPFGQDQKTRGPIWCQTSPGFLSVRRATKIFFCCCTVWWPSQELWKAIFSCRSPSALWQHKEQQKVRHKPEYIGTNNLPRVRDGWVKWKTFAVVCSLHVMFCSDFGELPVYQGGSNCVH